MATGGIDAARRCGAKSEAPGNRHAQVASRFRIAADAVVGGIAVQVEVTAGDVADPAPLVVALVEQFVDAGVDAQVFVDAIAAEHADHGAGVAEEGLRQLAED